MNIFNFPLSEIKPNVSFLTVKTVVKMPPKKRKITHAKKAAFWPCGSCRQNCSLNSIYCESCKTWFHYSCADLDSDECSLFEKSDLSFICDQCFDHETGNEYNYQTGLSRLAQVS